MKYKILLHYFFIISLVITGLIGILQIFSGAGVYFTSITKITQWIDSTFLKETLKHPSSPVSQYITQTITSYTISVSAKNMTVAWLFIHGTTNTAITYFALRKKLWIYPIAIAIFSILGLYQIYLFVLNPTIPLFIFALFGTLIAILTIIEYYTRNEH